MKSVLVLALSLAVQGAWGHDHSGHNHAPHACEGILQSESLLARAQAGLKRLEALHSPKGQEIYFKRIIEAARAALEKHDPIFRNDHHGRLDRARHGAILRAIAETDSQRLEFSAYKIKRTIEGRYSLKEYISCRP